MSDTVSRAPRRNRQFWLNHVEQWKGSGLSKAAYCQRHSINAGSFYNWSRPVRDEQGSQGIQARDMERQERSEKALTFTPVVLKPIDPRAEVGFVHVQRAATDIALPTDLNPDQIHCWLSAIHQLHV